MSSQVYSLLKNTRENKDMSLAFVASKTGISESTLHVIETGEIESLNIPSHTIEAYITRYGEFLGLQELPDYVLPKKPHSSGRLTVFDYLVRLAIIVVSALLIYHVVLLVKQIGRSNDQSYDHLTAHTTNPIANNNESSSAENAKNTITDTERPVQTPNLTKETLTNPTDQPMPENNTNQNNIQSKPNDTNSVKEETEAQAPINQPTLSPQTNNELTPRMPENKTIETTTASDSNSTDQQNWHKAMQTAIDNASFSN